MMWMVGGGVKRGFEYGFIDEYGYFVESDCVYMYDLYVIMFYFLGFDYEWFIYWYVGWDFWFIDVYGCVVDLLIDV